jgi:alkylated DNA repair dioxygenase AlkB
LGGIILVCAASRPNDELPEGFSYRAEFLSVEEEADLLIRFGDLNFRPFDFHGYVAKRRIVEYGLEYDFSSRRASATQPIPGFLNCYKERVAEWANLRTDEIVEAIVTEYPAGAPIGWHRDVPRFEFVVGVSLKSSCRLRFKPFNSEGKIVSVILQPRSVYLISGAARWKYQHSIPAVTTLRYSITFRTLKTKTNRSMMTGPH